MTTEKCTYCGEHHHYQHELVCDNVRQLYPLPLITDGEAVRLVEDYFSNEAKALRGDLIHKNTELLEEREQHAITKSQLDIANAKNASLQQINRNLRRINATKTTGVSDPQE